LDRSRVRESIIHQLLRSAVSNYFGRFINVGVWLLLTPFVLDRLESTLYGLWLLVGSVMAYGSLLDFGIAGAITKYVAEYRAKGQSKEAQQLVGTALVTYLVLGSIALAISIIVAPLFSRIFNVPPENHSTAMWLVILAGLGTGVAIPSNSTSAVLRGLQRFDILNLLGVISTLLLAGSMVVVLLLGGGVIGVAATGVAVNLLMLAPSIWIIHRIAPDLRFGLVSGNRQMLSTLTSFSSSMFMLRIGGHLDTKTDEIVIGVFLPVSAVTPYNLARRLSALPQMLTEQFLTLLLPLASQLHAENDQARLRSLYIISTRLTLAIFLPVGVSLIFLSGPFLTVWVGEAFADYAHLVIILSLASMIDTSTWPAGSVLQGMGLPRFSGVMSIISGVSNLILSLVLVQKIGLTGVALGKLLPTCIVCLGFVHPYVIRMLRIRLGEVFRLVILPALIPIAPAGVGMYILSQMLALTSILPILLVAASGSLIYLAVYLWMGANEFERAFLRKVWLEIVHRAKSYSNASQRSS
jgi:O-antigen/teichoic acid export membrane protein